MRGTRRLLVAGALVAASACGTEGRDQQRDATRAPADSPAVRRSIVTAVQLGSFADSANAARLRDSLAGDGWNAYVSTALAEQELRWRVMVQPAAGAELPRLVQYALRQQGRDAVLVRDTVTGAPYTSIELLAVNRGSPGMLRLVRWALSPDRRSLLAVEDPAGVENEPVPDGFVFVSENGPFLMQVDSVWDVAPSPDWERLAYGRAYVVVAARGPEVGREQWEDLADRMGLEVDSVRRAVFVSSSMNYAFATAQPVIVNVSDRTMATSGSDAEQIVPMAGGWRVAWTTDGSALVVGDGPARPVNDAPAEQWMMVDTALGTPVGLLSSPAARARVAWTHGPLLDISVPFDMRAARTHRIDGGRVTSRDGWIRLERDASGAVEARRLIVGPGAAMAATVSGGFIAAIVPRTDADEFEAPVRFVVYQIVE
ncbi:MAG TPA: SPOR domain-containing protein [Gemmatimonadaceae bacterium]|nr:SPOR domain-containing protein [Gemmatimonadaceae bacterium]